MENKKFADDFVKDFIKWEFNGQMLYIQLAEWERYKQSKEVKKEPLFITEDNVPVYEGDHYYSVNKRFLHSGKNNGLGWYHPESGEKYFSTIDAASEYILMNKPLLSLNDLLDNWDDNPEYYKNAPLFLKFKEVAKRKLK